MAHVRYNKILTHSHTTPGLSCHFSLYIFLWGGGGVGGGGHIKLWELRKN